MAYSLTQDMRKERDGIISKVLNNDLHGKCIYLLGSAEYGPTNEPILIKSTVGLHNRFGTTGTLINGWHAIKYVSKNNNVYCVKITGDHSSLHLNVNIPDGEVIKEGLVFYASQSNELFNDISVHIKEDCIYFKFPDKIGILPRVYKYEDYPTIELLINAINKETKQGKSFIYGYYDVDPATPSATALFTVNPSISYMYGGRCGLNYSKNMLYDYLARAYNILESHDIDIVVPLDAFMDDVCPDCEGADTAQIYGQAYYHIDRDYLTEDGLGRKRSFMDQLINFCIIQTNFGMVTTGVMGFNSNYKYWSRYFTESDDLLDMYKTCFQYNLYMCQNPWYAFLVSVVAGDILYNHGTIIDNGYLAYAAMLAESQKIVSVTNKPLSKAIGIWHEFSQDVLKDLADCGMVAFRHSPLYNTPVIYDAVTASPLNENLKIECNVRMIQMCISYMNELFQIYIGKDIRRLISEKIIQNDLASLLTSLVDRNVITWFEFKLVPDYSQGHLNVYLSLKTSYMIRAIHICSLIDIEYLEE